MAPCTCFKLTYFYTALFMPFIFTLSFSFQNYSFQTAAPVSGDTVLENLQLTVHVIIFYQKLFGFQSYTDFWFHGSSGLCVLRYISSYTSLGQERNAYRCLLNWLVQYGTKGKCTSFCCKNFYTIFESSCLMLVSYL